MVLERVGWVVVTLLVWIESLLGKVVEGAGQFWVSI